MSSYFWQLPIKRPKVLMAMCLSLDWIITTTSCGFIYFLNMQERSWWPCVFGWDISPQPLLVTLSTFWICKKSCFINSSIFFLHCYMRWYSDVWDTLSWRWWTPLIGGSDIHASAGSIGPPLISILTIHSRSLQVHLSRCTFAPLLLIGHPGMSHLQT